MDESRRQSQSDLPVRGRAGQRAGRHRRLVRPDLPRDAPALVLVAPTAQSADGADPAAEIEALARSAYPDAEVALARLDATGGTLTAVLRAAADRRRDGGAAAVVVPLLTGPFPDVSALVDGRIAAAGVHAVVARPLGPHPLLAETLHVRLADAGLARADRMRLLSVGAPVDGVVVATVGGTESAASAGVTAVLLAARLGAQAVPAALDGSPALAEVIAGLRGSGCARIAVAPCVIGPEADLDALTKLCTELDVGLAAPIGAHPAIAKLVSLQFEMALEELGYQRAAADIID